MKRCPVCSAEYPDDVKFCPHDGQTLRAAAPAADLVGQVVADRYHVIKKLGEGGMGQVYLAEHVKMGRRSAIKVMNPAMVHDPEAVARFNREAANASRITHPHVCAIYDFGETPDGLIYLAMEFIEGEPLTDVLERDGALAVPRAVGICAQVADALQAAHDLGIVHRDLKPDNIMLTRRRGGGEAVKVVDFGIAKAVGGDAAGQKVTKTGLVVGTPEFMSPEQLSGDTVDGRSDLYSLALVFYRMLTGTLPFEATSVQETMVKRLTDEPAKLAETRPDLRFPAGLQAVLDTALARSPLERYQSVAKFAADVAAVMSPTRPGADADSPTQLLDRPSAPATRPTPSHAPPVPGAAPRKRPLALVAIGAVVILGAGGAWAALSAGRDAGAGGAVADTSRPDTSAVARDTAGIATQGHTRGEQRGPPPPAPSGGGIDLARVTDSLDALFDRLDDLSGVELVTAARDLFHTPGAVETDRAMAAYLVATGYSKLDDRANTCAWARRAADLDATSRSAAAYADLRQRACAP